MKEVKKSGTNITATMGRLSLKSSPKQSMLVSKVINHPFYNKSDGDYVWRYDFALVKLAQEVQLSDEVMPIRLPDTWRTDSLQNKTGNMTQVAGFGATRGQSNDLSQDLMETELKVRCNTGD